MTPELHRPSPADRIGPDGLDVLVVATEAECAALARRMQVPAVLALRCRFRLTRSDAAGIEASGRLDARVVQTCVVSADDFEVTVAEEFTVRFVPAGQESDSLDPEALDEIPFGDGVLDLGEAAAEQLALALDPYPRQPGVTLPDEAAEGGANPFAALPARHQPN